MPLTEVTGWILTHFMPMSISIPSENVRKTFSCLTFSRGVEKEDWREVVLCSSAEVESSQK